MNSKPGLPAIRVSKRGRVNEGRPSKLTEDKIVAAAVVFDLGGTNADAARALQVDEQTIAVWLDTRPEFSAVQKNKDHADAEIVQSLFQRAKGYIAPDGTHIPGHPTAQIFWLKNRQRDKWRDRVEADLGSANAGSNAPQNDPEANMNAIIARATEFKTLRPQIIAWVRELLGKLEALR